MGSYNSGLSWIEALQRRRQQPQWPRGLDLPRGLTGGFRTGYAGAPQTGGNVTLDPIEMRGSQAIGQSSPVSLRPPRGNFLGSQQRQSPWQLPKGLMGQRGGMGQTGGMSQGPMGQGQLPAGLQNQMTPTGLPNMRTIDMTPGGGFMPPGSPSPSWEGWASPPPPWWGGRTGVPGWDTTWDAWTPNMAPSWTQYPQQVAQGVARQRTRGGGRTQPGENVQLDPLEWQGGQGTGQPSTGRWAPGLPQGSTFDPEKPTETAGTMLNYLQSWLSPQLINQMLGQSQSPYGQGPYNDPRYMPWSQNTLQGIGGYMNGTNPVMQQLGGMFGQGGDILGTLGNQYNYLLNSGLSGQTQLLDPRIFQQNQGLAQQNYGNVGLSLQDWFSRGMPGREQMQGLFNPQQTGDYARTGLNYLLQQGAPGRNLIENRMGGWGQQGDTAQNLLGGAYKHLMTQGLPGQVNFQDMILPGQQGTFQNLQGQNIENVNRIVGGGATPGVQDQAQNTISSMLQGGGLTPEYIQAMRNQVFEPGMEQLMGRINQQMGGTGELSSGLSAELQRRAERDFQDQLIRAGYGGMQGAVGQGLQAGQQAFGQEVTGAQLQNQLAQQSFGNAFDLFNALSNQGLGLMGQYGNYGQQGTENLFRGYQAIPGTELPILQMGLGQGQQDISNMFGARGSLMDEGFGVTDRGMQFGNLLDQNNFNRFNLQRLPLEMMNQAGNFGYSPFDRYGQYQQNAQNQGLNAWNQMGSDQGQAYNQAAQLAQLLQQGGLGATDILGSIIRSAMTGAYQESAAGKGAWGNIIGAGIQAAPWIIRGATGGGWGYGGGYY